MLHCITLAQTLLGECKLLGKITYELRPKVLSTPMSGISPEKKLVDKFLREAGPENTINVKKIC